MAKVNKDKATDSAKDATIGKEDMKRGSVMIAASSFDEIQGETFAGLNILVLKEGEAAGPIKIVKILKDQKLGKDTAKRKKKPVDVYCGEHNGVELRLPIAASFIMKAKEAGVAIGDVIAIKRVGDYMSQFNTRGASYVLKVISRGSKK